MTIMQSTDLRELLTLRPIADWHDDNGPVLWWSPPINEPPYVGTPHDTGKPVLMTLRTERDQKEHQLPGLTVMIGGWPGYHTHWSPIPSVAFPQS